VKSHRRIILVLFTLILCIGSDQITKEIAGSHLPGMKPLALVRGMLRLDYVENKGAVFAPERLLPQKWRGKNVTMVVAVFLGLSVVFLMLATGLRFPTVFGLSLFCGGSLSNLFDRIAFKRVVDFLKLGLPGFQPYIFNLADVAIGAGIIIAILGNVIIFVKGASLK
jgi:signal peptidase II